MCLKTHFWDLLVIEFDIFCNKPNNLIETGVAKMKLKLFLVASVFFLFGCQKIWIKPGGGQQEFAQDSYSCQQANQQRVAGTQSVWNGSAYVNQYSNTVQTNWQMYDSCMMSKGWTIQR